MNDCDGVIEKLDKLIHRIEVLSRFLKDRNHDSTIYLRMDSFPHMENIERLKVIKEHIEQTLKRLDVLHTMVELQYKEAFYAWKKDVRRLNAHSIGQRSWRVPRNFSSKSREDAEDR